MAGTGFEVYTAAGIVNMSYGWGGWQYPIMKGMKEREWVARGTWPKNARRPSQ